MQGAHSTRTNVPPCKGWDETRDLQKPQYLVLAPPVGRFEQKKEHNDSLVVRLRPTGTPEAGALGGLPCSRAFPTCDHCFAKSMFLCKAFVFDRQSTHLRWISIPKTLCIPVEGGAA